MKKSDFVDYIHLLLEQENLSLALDMLVRATDGKSLSSTAKLLFNQFQNIVNNPLYPEKRVKQDFEMITNSILELCSHLDNETDYEAVISSNTNNIHSEVSDKEMENISIVKKSRLKAAMVGIFLLIVVFFCAFFYPCPDSKAVYPMRFVLASVTGLLAAVIPFLITVKFKKYLALGLMVIVFGLIFYINPGLNQSKKLCAEPFRVQIMFVQDTIELPDTVKILVNIAFANENYQLYTDQNASIALEQIPSEFVDSVVLISFPKNDWGFCNDALVEKVYLANTFTQMCVKQKNIFNFTGTVIDEITGFPIADVAVTIDGIQTFTDENGVFKMPFSLSNAKTDYVLSVYHPAFKMHQSFVDFSQRNGVKVVLKRKE